MITVGIITCSDRASKGVYQDVSGKVIEDMVCAANCVVVKYIILPDVREQISHELVYMSDTLNINLVLTTGGTGFSPRDFTPEATLDVIDRLVPGIPEAMRAKSLGVTQKAMLSRATAGIRGKTLIINLPGSPKAVKECLEVFLDVLPHAIGILLGDATD